MLTSLKNDQLHFYIEEHLLSSDFWRLFKLILLFMSLFCWWWLL
jgi:hypothetical protein